MSEMMGFTQSEEEHVAQLVDQRLSQLMGNPGAFGGQTPLDELTLDEVLDDIDPADSESALKLFAWLQRNGRIHRVGLLDGTGYLLVYREPKGTTQEGWTHGGTQGDRVVDDALEKAQASGKTPALRGLCKKCFSPLIKASADAVPEAESGRDGEDPTVCSHGGPHEFHA